MKFWRSNAKTLAKSPSEPSGAVSKRLTLVCRIVEYGNTYRSRNPMSDNRPHSPRLVLSGPAARSAPRPADTESNSVILGVKRLFAKILPGGLGGYRYFANEALGFSARYDPTERRIVITGLSVENSREPSEGAESHDFARFLGALDDHCQKHPAGWNRATQLSLCGCSSSERLALHVGPARFRPR